MNRDVSGCIVIMGVYCKLFPAVCKQRCLNGGRCVLPDYCHCRKGYKGLTCAIKVSVRCHSIYSICLCVAHWVVRDCVSSFMLLKLNITTNKDGRHISSHCAIEKLKYQGYLGIHWWHHLVRVKLIRNMSPTTNTSVVRNAKNDRIHLWGVLEVFSPAWDHWGSSFFLYCSPPPGGDQDALASPLVGSVSSIFIFSQWE